MRLMLSLLFVLSAPPALAQMSNCSAPKLIGTPACPDQWVGVTSVAFDGITTRCRADFGPGARMCKSDEILTSDTLNFNAIPAQGCWLRPSGRPIRNGNGSLVALDESGDAAQPTVFSSRGWEASAQPDYGLVLRDTGGFELLVCEAARPVACCAPIPSPTTSLPIDVGGLVAIATMRGDA